MNFKKERTDKLLRSQKLISTCLKALLVLQALQVITLIWLKASLALMIPICIIPFTMLPLAITLHSIKTELKNRSNVQTQ